MARRRYIPPDFWESTAATSVSAAARLLLLGCWTAADDEGLLRWDAEEFKERFFLTDVKVTAISVAAWMDELVQRRLVLPYKDRTGTMYAYLVGFERDQKVSRPVPSVLPPPDSRAAPTINAYAYRDRMVCPVCTETIVALSTSKESQAAAKQGLIGIVLPRVRGGIVYPSQARVVHTRCREAAEATEVADTTTDAVSVAEPVTVPVTDPVVGPAVEPVTEPPAPPVAPAAPTSVPAPAPAKAPTKAPAKDETGEDDGLFAVSKSMVDKTKAPKKKRATPATWTPDRKDTAKGILNPWWNEYGEGWSQSYGVVLGVIIAALANKVPADDITKAMNILGGDRKPISGGTIAFALAHPTKKVREEQAYAERASARSTDKYAQRTL